MASHRKKIVLFLAASAGLAACAVGGALWHYTRPEVQRSLALDALRAAGWSGDIAGVAVGLGGDVSAEGVALTDPSGRRFALAKLSGEFSPVAVIFGDYHIGKLTFSGLVIDLSGQKPGGKPVVSGEVPESPTGAERLAGIPHVRADAVDADGRVILPGARELPFEVRVRNADTLSGGTAVFKVADGAGGPVVTGEARLKYVGKILSGGDPLAFWRELKGDLTLDAEARPVAGSATAATLAFSADAAGATLKLKSGANTADFRLTGLDTTKLALTGSLAIGRSAVAPWMNDAAGVPEFSTKGSVSLGYSPGTRAVDAKVEFSGGAAVSKAGPGGPRDFAVSCSLSGVSGGEWSIRNLNAKAGASGVPEALRLDAAFVKVVPGTVLRVETRAGEDATLRLRNAPLAWLNPFLPSGTKVASGDISGVLRLSRDTSGKVVLESAETPSTSDVALLREDKPWLDRMRLSLPVRVERSADGALLVKGVKARLTRAGETVAGADFSYSADAAGAGAFTVAATLAPGALPDDFLPGGACGFCHDTGLTLAANVSGKLAHGTSALLSAATVDAVTRDGVRALGVSLVRPVSVGDIPSDGKPLAACAFKGFPLGLFNPLLKGPSLGGVAESGDLQVARTPAGWKIFRPATGGIAFVRGLAWTDAEGAVVLAPTDARGSVAWAQTASGWTLDLGDITFANKAGEALAGRVAFAWADGPKAVEADVRGGLPALAASLPSAGKIRFATGAYALKAHQKSGYEWTGDLRLDDLRSSPESEPCSVALSGRASTEKGVTTFSAPISLVGPSGATRLSLSGSTSDSAGGRRWDATLNGGTLFADDWKALLSPPVPATSVPAGPSRPPAPAVPSKPDAAPFWAGNTGRFATSLDAVKISGETMGKPRVAIALAADGLKTEEFSAEARGLPVKGAATIDFKRGAPKPYVLKASGGVETLPLGRVIATVAPKASGWLDGDFNLRFAATGEGETPATLAANIVCTADAESTGGTLRFFRADNEAIGIAGEVANIGGDLAGIAGKILGKKDPATGRMLTGASVIQKALNVVKYDKLTFTVKRMPDGALELPSAEVFNGVLRLRASGRLGPAFGAAFLDRNATVTARLDGRNLIADALRNLGRASAVPDATGWLSGPELRYEGPLNNVRSNLVNNLFRGISIQGGSTPEGVIRKPAEALERALDGLGL